MFRDISCLFGTHCFAWFQVPFWRWGAVWFIELIWRSRLCWRRGRILNFGYDEADILGMFMSLFFIIASCSLTLMSYYDKMGQFRCAATHLWRDKEQHKVILYTSVFQHCALVLSKTGNLGCASLKAVFCISYLPTPSVTTNRIASVEFPVSSSTDVRDIWAACSKEIVHIPQLQTAAALWAEGTRNGRCIMPSVWRCTSSCRESKPRGSSGARLESATSATVLYKHGSFSLPFIFVVG